MKIFISADIEGISGVVNKTHTGPQGHDYGRARGLMTGEVNAAIEAVLEAGAEEVVVNDSHGPMTNLLLETINPGAQLITGTPKRLGMMEGIDETYDAVMLIGYHSRMNTPGILSHSYHSGLISNININGKDVGEFFINSAVAGHFGVPVIMVSGDNILADEVEEINPDIQSAIVKAAQTRFCAKCLAPKVVHGLIKEKIRMALDNKSNIQPIKIEGPVNMEVTFINSGMADVASIIPGVEQIEPSKVLFEGKDIIEAYRALMTMTLVAHNVI